MEVQMKSSGIVRMKMEISLQVVYIFISSLFTIMIERWKRLIN